MPASVRLLHDIEKGRASSALPFLYDFLCFPLNFGTPWPSCPGTGYSRISLQAFPDSASTQIRFGTAIRALQISEKFHTVSREQMQPRKAASP